MDDWREDERSNKKMEIKLRSNKIHLKNGTFKKREFEK